MTSVMERREDGADTNTKPRGADLARDDLKFQAYILTVEKIKTI